MDKSKFSNTVAGKPASNSKPIRQILHETRLSNPLPNRSSSFSLEDVPFPNAKAKQKSNDPKCCANCKTKLTADNQPLAEAYICRKCLAVYSVIDTALNAASEQKAREAKFARMSEKLSFME